MIRAHRIRLNPTPAQDIYFRKATGTARFTYNWALSRWKEYRAAGQCVSMNTLKREFNRIKGAQFPWVYDVTKCAAEREFDNLGWALSGYAAKKTGRTLPQGRRPRKDGEEAGFPRFKSRKREGFGSFYLANDKFSEGNTVTVPKLGPVNMTEALRFRGKILSATVSHHAGWWWISITVDVPHTLPVREQPIAVGVDLGVKTLATLSTGEVFENQKCLPRALRRITHLQRVLNRKQEGSRNWRKAHQALARAHHRVACQRLDVTHKLTTHLVRSATFIGLEDLNVAGIVRNHHLARAVSDAAFGMIRRQLMYKAPDVGATVVLLDRFFPSSQLHNGCAGRKIDLRLGDRTWICPECGVPVQRDYNAALNLRDEALRLMGGVSGVATSGHKTACGLVRTEVSASSQNEAGTGLCVLYAQER